RALQLPVVQNQEWAAIAKPELEVTSRRRFDGA
ncbi:MAG: hypothetical protein K0S83_1296, partial [Thermomicrobiales bacterium]|nr:hypothetical protein [Thermomicrobiales bacterium]